MLLKKILIITIFVLSNHFCIAQTTWQKISDSLTTGYIYDLQVDSEGNLFAAIDHQLLLYPANGEQPKHLYETDKLSIYILRILFITDNEILIGTDFGIFSSTDKGLTWSANSLDSVWIDFLFMDKNGIIYAGNDPIYKSTDKGTTWTELNPSRPVSSFYITSSGNFLAGTDCGIYLSSDFGQNWILTGFFDCGDVLAIKGIQDDGIIFIGGADRFHGIYFSTDDGYKWVKVNNSDTLDWVTSIIPTSSNEIYFNSNFNGVFKYNIQDSSITASNDGLQYGVTALALDSLGYLYAGSNGIFKTFSPVDTIKFLNNNVFNFSLEQNYPNPFNSTTTIEYNLPASGIVKIEVYDMLGQKVIELENRFQQEGKYKVTFQANSLSSGVYIYHMQIDEKTFSKKMIYLK